MPRHEHVFVSPAKIVRAGNALGAFLRAGRNESPHLACARFHALEGLEVGEPKLERDGLAGIQLQRIKCGNFCSHLIGIDGRFIAMNQIFVESVFHVRRAVSSAEKTRAVRLIFREQQFWLTGAQQPALAVLPMLQFSASAPRHGGSFSRDRAAKIPAPGPGVSKPKLRQDVQCGGFGPAIYRGDSNENVFDVGFGILDENVKIAASGKNTCVEQFKLRLTTAATLVLLQQGFVRKFRLRIFVEHAHVAVRGCRVEVKVIFLDVLAMIALISRKAKKPFFQNGVASIPQR